MTRMGYLSPGILGALVGLIYAVFGGDYSTNQRLVLAAWLVPLLLVAGQLAMVAAQGIFAGVLPVPPGKSIRGTKCVVVGLFVVTGGAVGIVAYLLARVEIGTAAMIVGGAGLACWLAAVGLYIWSVPTAVTDFVRKDGV